MPNVFKGTAAQIESNLNKVQFVNDAVDKMESYPSVSCMTDYVDSVTYKTTPQAIVAFLGGKLSSSTAFDDGVRDGYGSCTVIHDDLYCVVFDLGSDNGNANTLKTYLKNNNITSIDALFISHYHSDHFKKSAYEDLKESGYIHSDTLIVVPHPNITDVNASSDGTSISTYQANNFTNLIEADKNNGQIRVYLPSGTDTSSSPLTIGNMNIYCYNVANTHLKSYNPTRYNNCSMVNLVEVSGCKILITGDIEEPAITRMWNNNGVLSRKDIDIMTVPHHGYAKDSLPNNIINNIWSKYAVIQWAFDKDGQLINRSAPFAKTLLNNGCNLSVTYGKDDVERNVIYHLNNGNITPVQTGLSAGNLIPYDIIQYSDGNYYEVIGSKRYTPEYDGSNGNTGLDCYINRFVSEEYLTDEMFATVTYTGTKYITESNPVFTKLIVFEINGGIPSDTIRVDLPHGMPTTSIKIVELSATLEDYNGSDYVLPYIQNATDKGLAISYMGSSNFGLTCKDTSWGSDTFNTTIYVKVKYTKNN